MLVRPSLVRPSFRILGRKAQVHSDFNRASREYSAGLDSNGFGTAFSCGSVDQRIIGRVLFKHHLGVQVSLLHRNVVDYRDAQWASVKRWSCEGLLVGDLVVLQKDRKNKQLYCTSILPRHTTVSYLHDWYRPRKYTHEMDVAANVDQIVLLVATVPEMSLSVVDQYIAFGHQQGLPVILALNKVDLLTPEELHFLRREVLDVWSAIPHVTDVLELSAVNGLGAVPLRRLMQSKTTLFLGVSGVGKSEWVRALTTFSAAQPRSLSATLRMGTSSTLDPQMYLLSDDQVAGKRSIYPSALVSRKHKVGIAPLDAATVAVESASGSSRIGLLGDGVGSGERSYDNFGKKRFRTVHPLEARWNVDLDPKEEVVGGSDTPIADRPSPPTAYSREGAGGAALRRTLDPHKRMILQQLFFLGWHQRKRARPKYDKRIAKYQQPDSRGTFASVPARSTATRPCDQDASYLSAGPGFVIDFPGKCRILALGTFLETFSVVYPEIAALAPYCKSPQCNHLPMYTPAADCAVMRSVARTAVADDTCRWDTLQQLLEHRHSLPPTLTENNFSIKPWRFDSYVDNAVRIDEHPYYDHPEIEAHANAVTPSIDCTAHGKYSPYDLHMRDMLWQRRANKETVSDVALVKSIFRAAADALTSGQEDRGKAAKMTRMKKWRGFLHKLTAPGALRPSDEVDWLKL